MILSQNYIIKFTLIVVFAVLFSFTALIGIAKAEVYKYKDNQGNIYYVDSPSKIPEEFRNNEVKPHKLPNITRERNSLSEPLKHGDDTAQNVDEPDLFDQHLAKVEAMPADEIEEMLIESSSTSDLEDDSKQNTQESAVTEIKSFPDLINFIESKVGKPFLIGMFIALLTYIISVWTLLERSKLPGFGILVPVYNLVLLSRLGGFSGWWVMLVFIPVIGAPIWAFTVNYSIAKNFGRGDLFAFATAIFPFICIPVMAFSPVDSRR